MLNKYDCEFLVNIIKNYKESLELGYKFYIMDVVISKELDKAIVKYGIDWCNRLIKHFEQESNK